MEEKENKRNNTIQVPGLHITKNQKTKGERIQQRQKIYAAEQMRRIRKKKDLKKTKKKRCIC